MRGGRRAGAGRPAIDQSQKRVQMSLSVSQEAREWMRTQAAEQGVTMGVILEVLIDHFEDSCTNE